MDKKTLKRKIAAVQKVLAAFPTASKEKWKFILEETEDGITEKLEIFGPDYNEGRWLITYTTTDGSQHQEFSSMEETAKFVKENFDITWDGNGEYFPDIGDRHGDKPSFFRHVMDADMENVENSAEYHSNFLRHKRYSN